MDDNDSIKPQPNLKRNRVEVDLVNLPVDPSILSKIYNCSFIDLLKDQTTQNVLIILLILMVQCHPVIETLTSSLQHLNNR
jgi:hypothetical protein